MAVDTSVIGKSAGEARVVVERGPVANFAKAVKDDNPIYQSPKAATDAGLEGIPAPPTWPFVMEFWGSYPELQDGLNKVAMNPGFAIIGEKMQHGGIVLHGEQEFTYHRPIKVGDVLRGEGVVTDAYEKESRGSTMTFVVTETVWKDDATGEPVVTTRMNLIHRG
jgi:acyl dehydratase